MITRWFLLGVAVVVCCATSVTRADIVVPGNYVAAAGLGNDWDLENSPVLNDLGGGLFDLPISGLAASTRYEFKIVGPVGAPPAWGDGEIPDNGPGSPNAWFLTDSNGDATINLDRNAAGDGFLANEDRVTINTDATEFTGFFATGDWETEAGGAGDFSGGDPLFEMTAQGGGLYSVDVVISDPGSYLYKATGNGDFAFQWGTNGHLADAANWAFDTIVPNQPITFLLDVSKGAISVDGIVPEPASAALLGVCGLLALAIRRRR